MKKKFLALIALFLLITMVFVGCGSNTTGETTENADNDDETFIIGVDDQFPPLGYRDENGDIVGFDIDLAQAAAEEMGMKLKVQQIDWDAKELELEQGNIDAIWNGLTITPEREEEMLFTDPYLENNQVVVVPANSNIKNISDLADKNVGLQSGSSAQDALNSNPISEEVKEVVEYDENVSALQDLGIGRTDAVVVDSVVADWYIKDNNLDYQILEESLAPEQYGVAVQKDNQALLEKINNALNKIKNSDTGKNISTEWFGEDILYKG